MSTKKKSKQQRKKKSGGGATPSTSSEGNNNAASPKPKPKGKAIQHISREEFMRLSFDKKMKNVPPAEVVKRVGRGMGLTAYVVDYLARSPNATSEHHQYLHKMADEGLVSVLLGLLGRCVDEELFDVVDTSSGYAFNDMGPYLRRGGEFLEGYVDEPSVWLDILGGLVNLSQRENPFQFDCHADKEAWIKKVMDYRRETAEGICPMVKCLCDDMKRECFKSKKYWHTVFYTFVNLLYRLVGRVCDIDYNPQIVPILSNYEGLVETMVRCMFWGNERPDIIAEGKLYETALSNPSIHNFAMIGDFAGAFIEQMLKSNQLEDDYKFYYDGAGKEMNMRIGTELIVNPEYNPNSKVLFVSGLIDLLRGSTNAVMQHKKFFDRASILNTIQILIVTGCVDKQMLAKLISLGRTSVADYEEAVLIMKATYESTVDFVPEKKLTSVDSKFAAVIRAGAFEMILELLSRFKGRYDNQGIISNMGMTLQAAQSMSLHKYTKNAIASQYDSIKEALKVYDQKNTSRAANNVVLCEDIVQMIRTLVDMNDGKGSSERDMTTVVCHSCLQRLAPEHRNYCSVCNIACYCSRECQVQHWKQGGHKDVCKKSTKGRSSREVQKEAIHQRNLAEIGSKIYRENRSRLLIEATVDGKDILSCAIVVDLTVAPPGVKLVDDDGTLTNVPSDLGALTFILEQRPVDDAHTKPSADMSGAVTSKKFDILSFNGFLGKSIPWQVAQEHLRNHFSGQLEQLRKNHKLGEEYLEEFKWKYMKKVIAKQMEERDVDNLNARIDPAVREGVLEAMVGGYLEAELKGLDSDTVKEKVSAAMQTAMDSLSVNDDYDNLN